MINDYLFYRLRICAGHPVSVFKPVLKSFLSCCLAMHFAFLIKMKKNILFVDTMNA